MTNRISILLLVVIMLLFSGVHCRKHQLTFDNDVRSYFRISSFGFLEGGKLEVKLNHLTFYSKFNPKFGLTLTRTLRDNDTPYLSQQNECLPEDDILTLDGNIQILSFKLDLENNKLLVNCSSLFRFLDIKSVSNPVAGTKNCNSFEIPFKSDIIGQQKRISGLQFLVSMTDFHAVGLYSLYFSNCAESKELPSPVNVSVSIVEQNGVNYLSAEDMPLPHLCFLMSFIFFVLGCVWIAVLWKRREETFKIHYLMALIVYLKSLSLLFHGINYDIISKDGYPVEAWRVLYYITDLLKGPLLFITIVLIVTGWPFIKHILSDINKKIFMLVIPLQVLVNVAKIIMEESEESESQHYTWKEIFILVDLICCGVLIFPFVCLCRSIKHLQKAAQTDGKAAINLEKLKIFRRFLVMVICYVYFSRILVFCLTIQMPFYYGWLNEVIQDAVTLIFFILVGMYFQPASRNSYFRLSQDDDLETDEVRTQTGFTENAFKNARSHENAGWNE